MDPLRQPAGNLQIPQFRWQCGEFGSSSPALSRCSGDKRQVTVAGVLKEEIVQGRAAAGRGLLSLPRSQRMLELCEAFPADQGYVGPFPALACPPVGLTPGIRAVLVAPCRCFSASLALGCRDALAVPGAASPCQCLKGCSYIQMLSRLGEALRSWGSAFVPREINKQIK